jgi:hypothetical protein
MFNSLDIYMSLKELVDNSLTDKQRSHGYLDLYEKLLISKKNTAKNILEVGIGDFNEKNGGSVKLWYDYFNKATIHGLDILNIDRVIDELKNNDRIKLYTSINAYDNNFFTTNILNSGIKFDMLLDDGPHTLESILLFIQLYSQVMADDGILIIEDVQKMEYTKMLADLVPDNLKKYVEIYDLRNVRQCPDNIVFVINKNKLI